MGRHWLMAHIIDYPVNTIWHEGMWHSMLSIVEVSSNGVRILVYPICCLGLLEDESSEPHVEMT
jgi:hypothetical protein